MKTENLVVVGTFVNAFDADAAVGALEAAGIDVIEKRDDGGGMQPPLWISGVEVIVRASDAERAREVIRSAATSAPGPDTAG